MRIRGSKAKNIQQHLQENGFDPGDIDGVPGSKTMTALDKALNERSSELPLEWLGFSNNRKLILYIQLMCQEKNIDTGELDGFWGPQTDYAYTVYVFFLQNNRLPVPWRDVQPSNANPNNWPSQDERSIRAFYGDGQTNQVTVNFPYKHRLAWQTSQTVTRFRCHKKVGESILRVLNNVLDHYGEDEIRELKLDLWGGCLVSPSRVKKGGSSLSMHSWGIAVDYDTAHNKFDWGRDRAHFARPEYDKWWGFWEEEGWVSLGRVANFDWMHIQAAKL